MSIIQQLAERGIARPPKFLPANVHYETIMGSVAYGVSAHGLRIKRSLCCQRE